MPTNTKPSIRSRVATGLTAQDIAFNFGRILPSRHRGHTEPANRNPTPSSSSSLPRPYSDMSYYPPPTPPPQRTPTVNNTSSLELLLADSHQYSTAAQKDYRLLSRMNQDLNVVGGYIIEIREDGERAIRNVLEDLKTVKDNLERSGQEGRRKLSSSTSPLLEEITKELEDELADYRRKRAGRK